MVDPDWDDCWSHGKDAWMPCKRQKFTPAFRDQAARMVIETGHPRPSPRSDFSGSK